MSSAGPKVVGGRVTRGENDANTSEAGALFEAEMSALARGVELGPQLSQLLARRYSTDVPGEALAENRKYTLQIRGNVKAH